MNKSLAILVVCVSSASAQSSEDVMTNDTVLKMFQAGLPAATIIKTIGAADKVDFRFLGLDAQRLVDARVPDDVFKAMAARGKEQQMPATTPKAGASPPSGAHVVAQPSQAANMKNLDVTIVDRQNSETSYTYFFPGYSNSNSNTDINCFGSSTTVNCSGSTRSTGSSIPARAGSYSVRGATFSLKLPDGRVAIVNCESKYKLKGDYVNRRSCRIPLVNDIQAEFDGDKAKLKWPVSIDGRKFESETYKILAVLDRQTAMSIDNSR